MKTIRIALPRILFVVALSVLCSATHAEPSEQAVQTDVGKSPSPAPLDIGTNAPSVTITLSDGSVVKGSLCDETLPHYHHARGFDAFRPNDIVKLVQMA